MSKCSRMLGWYGIKRLEDRAGLELSGWIASSQSLSKAQEDESVLDEVWTLFVHPVTSIENLWYQC